MTLYEGRLTAGTGRYGVVVGRFNSFITERLLSGALDGFQRHGVADEAVDVVWVPGAYEIPVTARRLAGSQSYAAIVCLGAVIRGATPHFEYVCNSVAAGVSTVALDTGTPCIFGVLTTETIEQAIERAGAKDGNKGYDAAVSALEMADLFTRLP